MNTLFTLLSNCTQPEQTFPTQGVPV